MLKYNIFIQFVILYQLSSVSSTDDNVRETQRPYRGRYKYNSPVSFENYQPIPVAVVFDDGNARNEKSRDIKPKTTTSTEIPKLNRRRIPSVETVQPIPVAVVFDDINLSKNKPSNIQTKTVAKIESPMLNLPSSGHQSITGAVVSDRNFVREDKSIYIKSKSNPSTNSPNSSPTESYQPIPVAIVFDDINVGKDKSSNVQPKITARTDLLTSSHPTSVYQSIPVTVVFDTNIVREDKSINVKSKSTTTTKPNQSSSPESYQPIPVAVVFDDTNIGKGKPSDAKLTITPDIPKFNHPPSVHESIPVAVVFDDINVKNKENSNDIQIKISSTTEKLKTNKPFSIETYQPIPVAVVFDNDIVGNDKHHTILPTITKTTESLKEVKTTESEKKNTTSSSKNGIKNTVNLDNKNETFKVESTSSVYKKDQIPVSIVYEPIKINYVSRANWRRNNGRRRGRRPVQVDTNVSNTEGNTTNNTVTEAKATEYLNVRKVESQESVTQTDVNVNGGNENAALKNKTILVPIIDSENHVYSQNGVFTYSYEGGDGTKAFSRGELTSNDNENTGEAVVGGFSYKDKDGNNISLSYTADENGYRPVGAHLPTPPPIPPVIARALAYLATKTTPEPVTESLDEIPSLDL